MAFVHIIDELTNMMQECETLLYSSVNLLYRLFGILMQLLTIDLVLGTILLLLLMGLVKLWRVLADRNKNRSRFTVGIFHPYSGAGGGGERVLWCAVKTLQNTYSCADVIIYTGDSNMSQSELEEHVRDRFNLSLPRPVQLVPLKSRVLLEAWLYPRCTLLLQALGSLAVAMEAIIQHKPDVFLDTMGYSFVYPLVKLVAGSECKVVCYIHYPILSSDMLARVEERTEAHNNAGIIARSSVLTTIKSLYYNAFSVVYSYAGNKSDLIMVNSTWTNGHINRMWKTRNTTLVFPPCDIAKFASLQIIPYEEKLMKKVVSIGQFRPEKDHELQLRSFKRLLEIVSERGGDIDAIEVMLVLVGGVRGPDDEARVIRLRNLANELNISTQVKFMVNMPFSDLTDLVQESCVGLHTMWNEHFGISVVEMQASGLITVAHDSGGPQMDIVLPYDDCLTGLLASDIDSYAESMHTALTMCDVDREDMQCAARRSVLRFSDEKFEENFRRCMQTLLSHDLATDVRN